MAISGLFSLSQNAECFGELKLSRQPCYSRGRKREVVFRYHPQFLFEMEFRVFNIVSNLMQVMVSRPRSDLHINLPALRKLDTMLVV
jgi:hypothetical protein